ncbi:MAG TPA: hypothetical protein VF911_06390 [Thermoanaerobaculia bacterium]
MARKLQNGTSKLRGLNRVASAVKRIFSRGNEAPETTPATETAFRTTEEIPASTTMGNAPKLGTRTRREADIPLDVIANTYNPPFTGGKAGFRSDGSDHGNDQEFALGSLDERWNDEDRITNKSGDPRIGTHGRTYEPGEARTDSRSR